MTTDIAPKEVLVPTQSAVGVFRHVDDAFVVDHSAYDAYAPLIEADGRRRSYSGDLQRLTTALAPDALVLGHTFQVDKFSEVFGGHVTRRCDGYWWEV